MAHAFEITTTGTQSPVVFNDLAGRSYTHPTVSVDLLLEFSRDEIAASADVQAAIDGGHITVEDGHGNSITTTGEVTSHELGGDEHIPDTLVNLNAKIIDATLIDTGDSRLSDARTPVAHDLAGAEHNASTLAALNGKVSDATLIDTGDSRLSDDRDPTAHASEHTDGTDDIQNATAAQKGLATAAQITKLDGIEALAEVNPDVVSQVEAEAGTATTERIWTAERVKQAIDALGGGGGSVAQLFRFDANDATFEDLEPAAADSRNGHPILAFDDAWDERVFFHESMSRDYSDGNLTVDIDWVAKTATTGSVTWGVRFERIAPGGQDIDSDSFAASQEATSATNGTSGVVTRTSIALTQAQADAIAAGDAFRLRLQRVASDGGDDMSGDAQVLRVVGRQ